MKTNLDELWRSGLVRRWHTVPSSPEQNLGNHQWGVAVLILSLHPSPRLELVAEALCHDVGESWTGDLRADFKWEHADIASQIDAVAESRREDLNCCYELTDDELNWLKWMDMLELVIYTRHRLNLGDRYFEPIRQRCLGWVNKCKFDLPPNVLEHFWKYLNVSTVEDLS